MLDAKPADYIFSSDWMSAHVPVWNAILGNRKDQKILEIGSYEGRSACYLIETAPTASPLELHCIDPWDEYANQVGRDVEATFDDNTAIAMSRSDKTVMLHKHRGTSTAVLPKLLTEQAGTFDVTYIDGSHMMADVLFDAVICFRLLKVGGLMIFDDYLWSDGKPDHAPKPAVDAFVNTYQSKLFNIRSVPLYQFWVQKLRD